MSRAADSTIKGFLYQFNKTIIAIAKSEIDDLITIEGLIEDIDIAAADGTVTAIQCKYHEAAEKFTDSLIFKPLLQMAEAFSKSSSTNIKYRIFCHVPSEAHGVRAIDLSTLDAAMATKNEALAKIAARIQPTFNKNAFLGVVELEFGSSLDELEDLARASLAALGIPNADVQCLLYPNSVAHIAKISSTKDSQQRQITRAELTHHLSAVTSTAVSKWILASKSKREIMGAVKKQLRNGLSQNSRGRHFYLSPTAIEEFDSGIVLFINNYVKKYRAKAMTSPPFFAIDCDVPMLKTLQHRLFKKGVRAMTGLVGDNFEMSELWRDPLSIQAHGKNVAIEFDVRLHSTQNGITALNTKKGDDIFCVANALPREIDISDMSLHHLGINNFRELEYVMHLGETYE